MGDCVSSNKLGSGGDWLFVTIIVRVIVVRGPVNLIVSLRFIVVTFIIVRLWKETV